MSDPILDLRSDTVTLPTPGMRRAVADAAVGDDVLDGDPTTRALEERVAALLGHESALFFPTGTQANQVAVGLHTTPGTEMVVEEEMVGRVEVARREQRYRQSPCTANYASLTRSRSS